MKNFYIFGLQRSGTNYLQKLIERNLNGTFHNRFGGGQKSSSPAWKHSIKVVGSDRIANDCYSLIIHKNPYKWVESLCNRNSVDWVKKQVNYNPLTGDQEMIVGRHKYDVSVLAQAYHDFHTNWIVNMPKHIERLHYKIKYEDLLFEDSRHTILNEIKETFSVQNVAREWINPKIGTVGQSRDMDEARLEYYKKEEEFDVLKRKHIDVITEIVTPELIEKLGYRVL